MSHLTEKSPFKADTGEPWLQGEFSPCFETKTTNNDHNLLGNTVPILRISNPNTQICQHQLFC